MEQLVAQPHGLYLRALRPREREADFIASTDAVDSYDEVVEQSWDLERYLKNPVVLFGHQSRELPIGRCTRVGVVDGRLECTIQFATEEMNPKAEQVWRMVQEKMLVAVSVGFMPRTIRHEMRDGKEVYVLADNELHEISVVPVPANPEALAKMKAKARAAADNTQSKETSMELDKLKAALDEERTARATADQKVAALESDIKRAAEELAAARAERDAVLEASNDATANAAKATEERDAARAECDDLRGQLVDKEIEALVGVKILPAERDAMASLAKKDRASFDALVAARPALSLLSQVIENPTKAIAPASTDPAQELASLALRETA